MTQRVGTSARCMPLMFDSSCMDGAAGMPSRLTWGSVHAFMYCPITTALHCNNCWKGRGKLLRCVQLARRGPASGACVRWHAQAGVGTSLCRQVGLSSAGRHDRKLTGLALTYCNCQVTSTLAASAAANLQEQREQWVAGQLARDR